MPHLPGCNLLPDMHEQEALVQDHLSVISQQYTTVTLSRQYISLVVSTSILIYEILPNF